MALTDEEWARLLECYKAGDARKAAGQYKRRAKERKAAGVRRQPKVVAVRRQPLPQGNQLDWWKALKPRRDDHPAPSRQSFDPEAARQRAIVAAGLEEL